MSELKVHANAILFLKDWNWAKASSWMVMLGICKSGKGLVTMYVSSMFITQTESVQIGGGANFVRKETW